MKSSLLWALAFVLSGVPALAVETEPETRQERGDRAARLAEEYGVTREEIVALRDKQMGWGEIRHALAISRKAGVPLSEVVALRESGMGWGQVSRKYGFSLGEAVGKPHRPEVQRQAPPKAPGGGLGHGRGGGHGRPW